MSLVTNFLSVLGSNFQGILIPFYLVSLARGQVTSVHTEYEIEPLLESNQTRSKTQLYRWLAIGLLCRTQVNTATIEFLSLVLAVS